MRHPRTHIPAGTGGGVDRLWVVLPLDEHWDSYVRLEAVEGQPVIAELRVLPTLMDRPGTEWLAPTLKSGDWTPDPPAGGLTSRALRGVHLGRALELAYEALGEFFERERNLPRDLPTEFAADAVAVPRRPGSKGRDDQFYAVVASMYVDALERGSRKPVVDAAAALSKARRGTYEPTYVRDLLHVARQRGLLTRPPKGRAGGQLTDKARQVLDQEEQ